MNPRGIPLAQFETNLEADPKFMRLSRKLDSRGYCAALGAYMSIALRAWATASREPDPDQAELLDAQAVTDLIGVGLLDPDGGLPAAVFERWVGAVIEARRKDADRKRSPRDGSRLRRTPPDSAGLRRTPPDSEVEESRGEESREEITESHDSGAVAPRSSGQWVAFLVDPSISSKDRMTRWGLFWEDRFGSPIPPSSIARLAKAIKVHPGGVTGMMADLSHASLIDVKGDPLDYIAAKFRRTNGANDSNGKRRESAFDRDAFVVSG